MGVLKILFFKARLAGWRGLQSAPTSRISLETNRRLVVLLLLLSFHGLGQIYPVQLTAVTTPPYYNYLAHYGDQNNHLQVIATFTDFASPPVNVRFRFTIEGPGYLLRTRQDLPVGPVHVLIPGVPEFIQGNDLLTYLSETNLELVSGNVDLENLPEGFTTICVEAVKDGINAEVLSTKACTAFFLQYMQPPQAILPLCGSTVDTTQLFQTFQWSPPQNYLPAVGSDLTYTFSLYEWIDTTNYNIFQTGQGLVYQTQTTFPLAQVSNFDVAWQNGCKYVWRVQAQLTSNGLPVQQFTQNGISAPCSFYYGKAQSLEEQLTGGLIINVTAEALASRKGRALWTVTDETPGEGLSAYSSYVVEYRRKPHEGENYTYNWLVDTVFAQQQPIWQLEPGETYQVRVSGIAGNFVSEPSDIVEFTTPPVREYACGEADLPYFPANYSPLLSAQMGDVFQIGQFELEVTYVEPLGLTGHYKGRGNIKHDFIGGAKVKVRFDDLEVDNNYVVRDGVATAVTRGVDDWLNDEYLDLVIPDTVDGVIESGGFVNDSTVFVVVNGDSLFFEFDGNLPIVIHGDNNVEYQFWPDGTMVITTYGIVASNDQLDATEELHVRFEEAPNQPFGFDKKQYAQFNDNYEIIVCQDQYQYPVPNQSKSTGGTTQVKAVIHGTIPNFLLSELTFELAGGHTQVPYTRQNDSIFLLTLPARSYDYMVYAVYADLKLGKLNVKSYVPLTKKVRIVPLTNIQLTAAQIEEGLNGIFKGANLTLDVTIAPVFSNAEFTASTLFQNPETSVMSKYTTQMRELRSAYLAGHSLEENEYLIFVINGFEDSNIDGYMVRGRGLGFIAQSTLSSVSVFTRTLAHELGHGMGGLEHAWGDNESLKGTTNNLLDYANGSVLIKNQWSDLRNPGLVVSLFDGEEDGSMVGVANGKIPLAWFMPDSTIAFFTVGKTIVKFDHNIKKAWFNWGVNDYDNPMIATGTLYGFTYLVNDEEKVYYANVENGQFKGFKAADNSYFTAFAAAASTDSVVIALPNFNEAYIFKIANSGISYQSNSPFSLPIWTVATFSGASLNGEWTLIETRSLTTDLFRPYNDSYLSTDGMATFSFLDFVEQDYRETYLTYCKIAELRSAYPEIFDRMTRQAFTQWDAWKTYISVYWNATVHATIDPTDFITNTMEEGYFDYIYVLNDYESLPKNQVIHKFLLHFKELIDVNRSLNASVIDDIHEACTGFNPAFFDVNNPQHNSAYQLRNAIECMSVQELSQICTNVKVHMIGTLLHPGSESLGITTDSYERAIDKLFWTTPKDKEVELLTAFCAAKRNNELIAKTLVDAVDDETFFIGSDYNTKIMNWIMSAYANYPHAYKNLTPQNATAEQLEQIKKRIVCYNYTGWLKRLFKSIVLANNAAALTVMESNGMTDVSVNSSTEKVTYVNESVVGFYTVSSAPSVSLNLLDPVIIDDKANLLNVYAENGGGKFAPAIILYFIERKADAQSTVEAIQTAVDVASLLIPGSQATMTMRILNYADKVSSVSSIVATATAEDYPELSKVLNVTSTVLGIVDFSSNGVQSLKNLNSNPSNAVNLINRSEDILDAGNHIEHVENLAMRILNETPDPLMNQVLHSSNPKSRALLEDVLVKEKHIADGAGRSDIVAKLDDALDVVRSAPSFSISFGKEYINGMNGLSDNISELVSQNGLTITEYKQLQQIRYDEMTISQKIQIDNIRNSIPSPDGSTILQKVIPKSQIQKYLTGEYTQVGGFVSTAKDSKHLNTFEDIYYGMRLDYQLPDGSYAFSLADNSCGVIRYRTSNPNLEVPKLPETQGSPPFTGNGMTGGNNNRLGVPEWKSPYYTPEDGAELWEIFNDGTEVLKGFFYNGVFNPI